jgi:hypothetical protein
VRRPSRRADDAGIQNGYGRAMARRCALLLALAVTAFADDAAAMTVPSFTDAELAARSDLIVEGLVVHASARRIGRRVMTFYVVEYFAAGARERTLVAVPGGADGRFVQKVPGAPLLQVGARYRLHLGRPDGPRADADGPPSRGIVGFFRGAAMITADRAGQPVLVPFTEAGEPRRSVP